MSMRHYIADLVTTRTATIEIPSHLFIDVEYGCPCGELLLYSRLTNKYNNNIDSRYYVC